MNCISVCPSQTVIATIHPPLNVQASHNRLYNDSWSQISSNFLARCYTTSAKTKSSKWGFTASFQSTAPLGALLNESQTAAQLDYLADLPCHQLLQPESYTLSLYGHILAVNHWAEWTSLECLLGCQMIVCKSKQGPNLIGVRHISALSVMKVR